MSLIVITGRLGRAAELRTLQSGKPVCQFSIADDIGWGENKKTQWIQCALFGDRAAKLAPHLTKGKLVEVHGVPQAEGWEKDGKVNAVIKVNVNEVKLHGGGEKDSDIIHTNAPGGSRRLSGDEARDVRRHVGASSANDMDSDIPF